MEYSIQYYVKTNKDIPFYDWLEKQDRTVKYLIIAKLERISLGNFSSCKSLGEGISEIKIDVGPGYRIYYSMVGVKIVLILLIGSKRTQKKDIEKALEYLNDYKMREKKIGKK